MLNFYRKYYKTAFDIALIVLTVWLVMSAFSFVYRIATPIILALVIFYFIEPMARFMHKRGMKKTIAAAIAILIFMLIILAVIVGLGAVIATQIIGLQSTITDNAALITDEITKGIQYVQERVNALPPGSIEKMQEYIGIVTSKAGTFASSLLGYFVGLMTSLSTFIANFSIAIILAYFLSIEIPFWRSVADEKTPKTFKKAFAFLRDNVLKGIVTYVKAQLKLISFTFIIILVSLLILRVDNALSIAMLAAIFDVLPLLGVSAVFLPWIVYCFIVGDLYLAIGLTVVLGIVLLFRQIMEPKITGDSLGVSAFTVLSAMMISLSLFGVAGLILSPVLIILLKALYEQGYLQRWIRMPAEEYETDKNPAAQK
ncbi:sporulation integral membrane protein YtvI [Paenibacillus thermotolerans]|uniref:sporulation integral membrane protein YtvI n=1 Tax=Paenibacillus thermotolerans TaxID=3027807 RepID=UPI0023676697|nr:MULTISPECIES: sporulation integral membrane protein YtvI [unclassified Paenibacillus]